MTLCNQCGGAVATESDEIIAATPCKCIGIRLTDHGEDQIQELKDRVEKLERRLDSNGIYL